jgi:RHS repeat-associated protein
MCLIRCCVVPRIVLVTTAVLVAFGSVASAQGDRRLRDRRLPATALLLTALLLFPANALAQTTTQVVEYYHTDALGSVRAVMKQVNGPWQVTRYDYMLFGETVTPQNPPVDKRLFTGKEREAETGMDYFGARYYRAGLGRFTTVDPLGGHLEDP